MWPMGLLLQLELEWMVGGYIVVIMSVCLAVHPTVRLSVNFFPKRDKMTKC